MLASAGKKIVFHDTSSYNTVFEYGCYSEPVESLNWSYDSKYLVVVPQTSKYAEIIRPYETEAKVIQKIKVDGVRKASFFNNTHRYIGIGCNDGQAHVWDTKKQAIHKTLVPTLSKINCLDISITDNYLAAGCENGGIILYGITTNQKLQTLEMKQSKRPITSLHFSLKERGIVGATNDEGCVAVWDILKRNSNLFFTKKHASICSDIALSPINRYLLVSVGYDKLIYMYDLRVNQPVCTRVTNFALTSVDMTPDGLKMVCGHRKGGILIYDLRNNDEPIVTITPHSGVVSSVAFYKDRKFNCTDTSQEFVIEENITTDVDKTQVNQSVSSEQLNNSFMRLNDSPCMYNAMPTVVSGDLKLDSFCKDLGSPFGKLEFPSTPADSSEINSQKFSYNMASPLNLVTSLSHASTPDENKKNISDVSGTEISVINSGLNIDNTQIVTRSDLDRVIDEFDKSLKKHSFNTMQMMNTNMLRLHMVLCKQHLELLDKFNSCSIQTSTSDLHKELKRLQTRNEELNYEVNYMRAEREKYLPTINGNL